MVEAQIVIEPLDMGSQSFGQSAVRERHNMTQQQRPLEQWVDWKFAGQLSSQDFDLRSELEQLEQRALTIRARNVKTLEAYAARCGPNAPPPPLLKQSVCDEKRMIQIMAEREVISVCRVSSALKDPFVMREALKRARDTVGEVLLYESELKIYLRAKNAAIGWRLVGLRNYIGPDPGSFETWGVSSQPPTGEKFEAALNECWGLIPRVARGSRPLDPEFAPDAVAKAHER